MIVHLRIPPAPLGREQPQRISSEEYRAVVDRGEFTADRYECRNEDRVLTSIDFLRDLRQRNCPKREVPSAALVATLVGAQGDLITLSRLLGRIAAGTDSLEELTDSVAWLREAATCFERAIPAPSSPAVAS